MPRVFLLPALLFTLASIAQIKEVNPKQGNLIDKTPAGEITWNKQQQACEAFIKKADDLGGYDRLSAADKKRYDQCSENELKGYWDAIGEGCSWYCGGGPDSVWASSALKPMAGINYKADNAHDLSYKTAWVEGMPGSGIGEYLVYRFSAQAPRITKIIVVNGYVKSEKAWRDNARVKKLKLYINNKPFAILNLQDKRNEQIFGFEPIGNNDRDDWEALAAKPAWTMKFEIMEVYKGDRFEDCAITEIYFDGIDVHCFGAGTNITMADASFKNIEAIQKGDKVMSYDAATQSLIPVTVLSLVKKQHASLMKMVFDDREIICTADHPFFTQQNSWASLNPGRSNLYYLHKQEITGLHTGEKIFMPAQQRYATLLRFEKIKGPRLTYTLQLAGADNFIANGLLVKTEQAK
jgi:hypothetical protein